MSGAQLGLLVGMALAFAAWFGGFGAFLLVAALGGIGFAIGRALDQGVDGPELRQFLDGIADRRR
ncbi:hypothetical protein [Streptomyces sp. H27-C3]|uniref:hypothetical protein n=1 Tax=Streptomyces sp. H27-C3 TaxID=3046305 RepID=UPI0024BA94E4|nr:hypothetical protein [Streptomyces sp. H27-C3]MDJ0463029.1 hypothetical protein [Streptomyces sp. H27-C3]